MGLLDLEDDEALIVFGRALNEARVQRGQTIEVEWTRFRGRSRACPA